MRIYSGRQASSAVDRLAARGNDLSRIEARVRRIVNDVRRGGDRELRRYAKKFEEIRSNQPFRVAEKDLESAWGSLAPALHRSLREAAQNIRRFCQWQKISSWTKRERGMSLGQIVQPLESVGCYVPGGRYPLVSTVLMTVIPAQVAGVKNIRVVSPKPTTEVLAAAAMLGVTEFYRTGGAQAIAALAYGTESIPRVDKIVGPGNAYVTMAKKLVAFDCAIDFLAGPTEAVIMSESGRADYIAAEIVAQAEHDSGALAVFITTSRSLAKEVQRNIERLAQGNRTAEASLQKEGMILIATSRIQAREWANRIAPEHISVEESDLRHIRNAGSIFVGDYSAQAAGDYASGPNHVLPTSGQARFRGGLSVLDFVKVMTVQNLSLAGLSRIAGSIECLAEAEGLAGHANSIRLRCQRA